MKELSEQLISVIEAAEPRPPSVGRIIAGYRIDERRRIRPPDHRLGHHVGAIEAELAFDDAPRRIDALDVDRHVGPAGPRPR